MKLKSLEIHGFKTFPNKTKIEFVEGISAVVGPNGSGKSNVSDALRWVLGEQSVKNLRCSKLEDVVFAGSSSRRANGFAVVKLIFDNKDQVLKEFGDEVSVTRKYSRAGESEYFIDSKSVRLKDINELFMDTGLGKDGYSIIGQGGIDEIVKAKPAQRREIFEEAAGISGCRYKKEDAQLRLKKADENLVRIRDILSELESRVIPLKKQAENAKIYLNYSEKKKDLEISLWVKEIENLKEKINANKEKLLGLKQSKFDLDETLANLETKIEENSKNSNFCVSEFENIRSLLEKVDKDLSDEKNNIVLFSSNVKHSGEMRSKLKLEIEENRKKISKLKTEISKKITLLKEKESNLNEVEKELKTKIQNLDYTKDVILNYENKKFELESQVKKLQDEKNNKDIKFAISDASIKQSNLRCQEINEIIFIKENEIKNIKIKIEKMENESSKILKIIEEIENEVTNIKTEIDTKKEDFKNLESKYHTLKLDLESNLRKIKILKDLESSMDGFSHSVKSVISLAKSGKLSGILGTVSDVFSVSKKFSAAIDVSLGFSSQNIITTNENEAKEAIKFLKDKNLGRATFLPVSLVCSEKIEIKNAEKFPGFIGIASDLCTCEEKYTKIKEYLLGRTIVSENLETAINLSKGPFKKFRIVTLDSQIVSPSGALTGGSFSNKTGFLSRKSEIQDLELEIKKLREKLMSTENDLEDVRENINESEKVLKEKENKLGNMESQKNLIFSDISKFRSEENVYRVSLDELFNEKKLQEDKVDSETKNKKDLNENLSEIKSKIDSLNFELLKLKKLNDTILKEKERKNLEIQDLNLKIASMQKEIGILEVEISLVKEEENEKTEKIENMILEIKNLEVSDKEMNEKIKSSTENISFLKEKKKNFHLSIEKEKEKRENLEKESVELRKQEKDKLQNSEVIIREISKLEERESIIQKNYDYIIGKLWDEYNLTFNEAKQNKKKIESENDARKELEILRSKIKKLGHVNLSSVEEYEEVNNRYLAMKEQVDDIEMSKSDLIGIIDGLNKDMKTMFIDKFNEINKNFSFIINELFGGATGKLILDNPEDILSCGINISVKISGKKEINLEALSGGEKVLVAISLYFAIIKVNPPPFCVLDEIEAALDDVNVDRFAKYLRNVCSNTQFILITHRRGTMEEADVLFGVTMEEEGVSKLLELKLNEAVLV